MGTGEPGQRPIEVEGLTEAALRVDTSPGAITERRAQDIEVAIKDERAANGLDSRKVDHRRPRARGHEVRLPKGQTQGRHVGAQMGGDAKDPRQCPAATPSSA